MWVTACQTEDMFLLKRYMPFLFRSEPFMDGWVAMHEDEVITHELQLLQMSYGMWPQFMEKLCLQCDIWLFSVAVFHKLTWWFRNGLVHHNGPLFDFPATLFLHFMYILFTLCVHFNIGHEYGAVHSTAPFKAWGRLARQGSRQNVSGRILLAMAIEL